jgi:hypothetical protein
MKSSNFVLSRAASFVSFDQEVPKLLGLQSLFACKKLKSILCLESRNTKSLQQDNFLISKSNSIKITLKESAKSILLNFEFWC